MNLPNQITLSRLVMTGFFLAAGVVGGFWGYLVALVLFVVASVSDWVDGYLARRLNLVSSFGKLMDPLADKILVSSAFLLLVSVELCPVAVAALIVAREFTVTGLRQLAVEQRVVIAADGWGKWKTGFQLATCLTALLWLTLREVEGASGLWTGLRALSAPEGVLYGVLLWGGLFLTVFSGGNYLWKNRQLWLEG